MSSEPPDNIYWRHNDNGEREEAGDCGIGHIFEAESCHCIGEEIINIYLRHFIKLSSVSRV